MDANEITCPKCGHLNNYISEGCVKCGIIFSKYLEMQAREKELAGDYVPWEVGKSDQKPVPDALEPVSAEGTIELIAEAPSTEPRVEPSAEEQPAEEPSTQPIEEISIEEIEMPLEELSDTEEGEMPIPAETPPSGEAQQAIEHAHDKTAEPVSQADTAPVASELQAGDQTSIQETQAQVPGEASTDPSPPFVQNDATPQAEDVLERVESVKPETEAKADTEPKTEEHKPQMSSESAPVIGAELTQNDIGSTVVAEKDKDETPGKEAAVESEAEILLEEVVEPVKAEAKPEIAEDAARTELLKKQKAALARAAALKKQELSQAKLEALKKQKAAQARAEAQKKHTAQLAKAKALNKQKLEAKIKALKQQKSAQAAVETQTQETQATVKAPSEIQQSVTAKGIESNLKIMALLKKYEGQTIGINYDSSAEIKEAELVEANDEFFSVAVKDRKLQYSYPLQTLLSLIEGEDGVETEESGNKTKYSAVIKVYPWC